MIATDGAPTICSGPRILMERVNAGWEVTLRLCPDGSVAIAVDEGDGGPLRAAVVPPEKALDAFDHPYYYLPR